METRALRPGTTLIELVFALTLIAILTGIAVPPLRRAADEAAARSARDALAASVARARAVAVARGGAELIVDARAGMFWIESPSGRAVGEPIDLAARFRVQLHLDGATDEPVALVFDGRGLGRMTNRTFEVRRGSARAWLTLSAYGRPRRW